MDSDPTRMQRIRSFLCDDELRTDHACGSRTNLDLALESEADIIALDISMDQAGLMQDVEASDDTRCNVRSLRLGKIRNADKYFVERPRKVFHRDPETVLPDTSIAMLKKWAVLGKFSRRDVPLDLRLARGPDPDRPECNDLVRGVACSIHQVISTGATEGR
jgi:hypothetical protein